MQSTKQSLIWLHTSPTGQPAPGQGCPTLVAMHTFGLPKHPAPHPEQSATPPLGHGVPQLPLARQTCPAGSGQSLGPAQAQTLPPPRPGLQLPEAQSPGPAQGRR